MADPITLEYLQAQSYRAVQKIAKDFKVTPLNQKKPLLVAAILQAVADLKEEVLSRVSEQEIHERMAEDSSSSGSEGGAADADPKRSPMPYSPMRRWEAESVKSTASVKSVSTVPVIAEENEPRVEKIQVNQQEDVHIFDAEDNAEPESGTVPEPEVEPDMCEEKEDAEAGEEDVDMFEFEDDKNVPEPEVEPDMCEEKEEAEAGEEDVGMFEFEDDRNVPEPEVEPDMCQEKEEAGEEDVDMFEFEDDKNVPEPEVEPETVPEPEVEPDMCEEKEEEEAGEEDVGMFEFEDDKNVPEPEVEPDMCEEKEEEEAGEEDVDMFEFEDDKNVPEPEVEPETVPELEVEPEIVPEPEAAMSKPRNLASEFFATVDNDSKDDVELVTRRALFESHVAQTVPMGRYPGKLMTPVEDVFGRPQFVYKNRFNRRTDFKISGGVWTGVEEVH